MMGMNRLSMIPVFLIFLHGCGDFPTALNLDGDTVVLDWTGGDNPLWADGDLPPLDLADLPLEEPRLGDTLADIPDFREMVRAEVEKVLTESGLDVTVENGEQRPMVTVVHFSPVIDPDYYPSMGRGHIDVCNSRGDDFSIIYVAKFINASELDAGKHDVDEWTHILANVAAHEIAHNLGFEHVRNRDVPEESEFVELMLGSHNILQRMKEQRILVEQDICDTENVESAKVLESELDRNGRPTRACQQ